VRARGVEARVEQEPVLRVAPARRRHDGPVHLTGKLAERAARPGSGARREAGKRCDRTGSKRESAGPLQELAAVERSHHPTVRPRTWRGL